MLPLKTYADVICVSSVDDYAEFLDLISENNGTISEEDRKRFAGKAFNDILTLRLRLFLITSTKTMMKLF